MLTIDELERRLSQVESILQATRKRLDDFEAKGGKRAERKAPDVSNAKPINLRELESAVVDGEMFTFNGKYFWHEDKGKFTKIAFSPLDAGRDEKCGKFFTTFDSLPGWLQKGMACSVVGQCKAKPPYMNYNIVSIAPMTAVNSPQYAEPAMQYQAPLPVQTFAPDADGPDESLIPF